MGYIFDFRFFLLLYVVCLVSIHKFDQVSRTYRMKVGEAFHHVGEGTERLIA